MFIYLGKGDSLSATPSQVIDSPLPGRTAFGFTLRSGADIDSNGYPGTFRRYAADRSIRTNR